MSLEILFLRITGNWHPVIYSMRGRMLDSCFLASPLDADDAVLLPSNVAMNTYGIDGNPSADCVHLIHRWWASLSYNGSIPALSGEILLSQTSRPEHRTKFP